MASQPEGSTPASGIPFSAQNNVVHEDDFRLEDYLDDSIFGDLEFPHPGTLTSEPVSSYEYMANNEALDFNDLNMGGDEPADNEFVVENHSQVAPGLSRIDTFDPDFWFDFSTGVDLGSPLPPGVFHNTRSSNYSQTPDEVQLQQHSTDSLAGVYGYSQLLQPEPNSAPLHLPADSFPTLPVGRPQLPQFMQQDLPELNSTYNPVTGTLLNANTLTPSQFSVTETGSTGSSATLSSRTTYQRGAAARAANSLRIRLMHQRQNHQQRRERILEERRGTRESRRFPTPSPALSLPFPQNVRARQPTPVRIIPAPVMTPGPTTPKEHARTGEVLGNVRHVEQFYTHPPHPAPSSVIHVPLVQRGPAPLSTSPMSAASGVEQENRDVILTSDHESDSSPRPRTSRPRAHSSPPHSESAPAVGQDGVDVVVVNGSDFDSNPQPLRRSDRIRNRRANRQ
ncbi:hypothetical protein AYL99_05284 [Fonsecaea erecta]|uniref:Uncharacterized protein n=1 Tax=Fonsecaea erecta TaxID=1367422 RepID=A0A178ZKU1_9EURO|nr:hypothetical protein AYL99_05284 [Fonsecaea erecta]OAP60282.1 hypothetical protein AYL99_05284 [Fonsecaea erecta]